MVKLLSIDPGSNVLGYAVFDEEKLMAWGDVVTSDVYYERKYLFIIDTLHNLMNKWEGFDEISCEKVIRFAGKRIPALEIVATSIKKWGERNEIPLFFYTVPEWRASLASGKADKEEIGRIVHLLHADLPQNVSNHITDAIGIGWHRIGIRAVERMSGGESK